MSDYVPASKADPRPFTKVLSVIPIGVVVLTVLAVVIDLLTGALHL